MPDPQPAKSRLLPGDEAPLFSQATLNTKRYAFGSAAGRHLVLCFFGSAADPHSVAALQEVMRRSDLFDDAFASFFGSEVRRNNATFPTAAAASAPWLPRYPTPRPATVNSGHDSARPWPGPEPLPCPSCPTAVPMASASEPRLWCWCDEVTGCMRSMPCARTSSRHCPKAPSKETAWHVPCMTPISRWMARHATVTVGLAHWPRSPCDLPGMRLKSTSRSTPSDRHRPPGPRRARSWPRRYIGTPRPPRPPPGARGAFRVPLRPTPPLPRLRRHGSGPGW